MLAVPVRMPAQQITCPEILTRTHPNRGASSNGSRCGTVSAIPAQVARLLERKGRFVLAEIKSRSIVAHHRKEDP
jgi:hypothetical protein